MPVKPDEVAIINEQILQRVIEKIDTELADVAWARSEMRDGTSNPHWMVVGSGELTEPELRKVEDIYKKVGWGTVRAVNSSGRNERPGLWSVTLFKYQQAD